MSEIPQVLRVGSGTNPVTVTLTDAALELLRDLPGGGSGESLLVITARYCSRSWWHVPPVDYLRKTLF